MPIQIQELEAGIFEVSVHGAISIADRKQWETAAIKAIASSGKIRALIVVEADFKGWQKSEAWGDVEFMAEHGDKVEKIAFVGDPNWKEQMFMFAGEGLRSSALKYFDSRSKAEALTWVRQ